MPTTDSPTNPGLYAFRGYRRTPSGKLVWVQDAVRVEPPPYGKGLAVRLFNGATYRLADFEGEWTQLQLPW